MLRKIDRYIIARFVPPIILVLVVIYGLYASFDLLQSLDDLKREGFGRGLRIMMRYYTYFFPVFSLDLTPGAILIAAGLVLVRMARHRELLALKSTGVSIRRVTLPIFVVTIAISVGIAYLKDFHMPHLARRCDLIRSRVKSDVRHNLLLRGYWYRYDKLLETGTRQLEGDILIQRYDPSKKSLQDVFILHRHANRALRMTVHAKAGRWEEGGIVLQEADVYRFNRQGLQEGERRHYGTLQAETSLKRTELDVAGEELSTHMTLKELSQLIEEYPSIPGYRVIYHNRISSMFSAVILLLVGLPLLVGATPNPRSRFVGVSICIAVATAYYVFSFVSTNMGNAGTVNPLLAAWLPTILMGALGIILFDHLPT